MKKYNTEATHITLKLKENPRDNPIDYIKKAIEQIVNEFIKNKNMKQIDRVGITLGNITYPKPIFISYRSPDQISSDIILNEVAKVVQSNENFLTDEPLAIKITRVEMPEGKGVSRRFDLKNLKQGVL